MVVSIKRKKESGQRRRKIKILYSMPCPVCSMGYLEGVNYDEVMERAAEIRRMLGIQ